MVLGRRFALLRVLACLFCLAGPQLQAATAAPLTAAYTSATRAEEKEESCGRGKATKDFGWKVVSFGIDTLKYLIGLFIIPVGLFLVVIGLLLQMVEAVAC